MTSRKGLLLILSSPSGAGKSTLARQLIAKNGNMQFSVSATTRDPRPGEEEGREYYFRTHEQFSDMAENGDMLEHAMVFGNAYGTPRGPVVDAMASGKDVIFDVDWQGGQQIRASDLRENVVSVFLLPPSIAELERRLLKRAQDSAETVDRRMAQARSEISHWHEYDYVLINDDLDRCASELDTILAAERMRRLRQTELPQTIEKLNAEFERMRGRSNDF